MPPPYTIARIFSIDSSLVRGFKDTIGRMEQIERVTQHSILTDDGKPVHFGWASRPLYLYNREKVRAPRRLVTEQDRYCFFSQTHLFLFEIEDAGFLGSIRITGISLRDKKPARTVFTVPFSLGSFNLPPGSESGSIRLHQKNAMIEFWTRGGGTRIIKIDIPLMSGSGSLRGEVVLAEPEGAQTLMTNMGWRREKHAFRLTRTSPWYLVEGVIQTGNQDIVLTAGNAFGIFDWVRGSRPRSDLRYRAFGCGMYKKRFIGFSLGYSTADSEAATENAFFLDGKLHKLGTVTFQISPKDWLRQWQFTNADGKIELVFQPVLDAALHNRVFLHSNRLRQFFGYFSGKVIQDDGSFFVFRNITGMAEQQKTKW